MRVVLKIFVLARAGEKECTLLRLKGDLITRNTERNLAMAKSTPPRRPTGSREAKREEKASACFGRNDRLTWSVRGLALGGCAGGEFLGSQILGVGGDVPTVSAIVYEAGAAFAVELVGGFAQ
jgi:hypothetical protein